jgi:hypothetical protein
MRCPGAVGSGRAGRVMAPCDPPSARASGAAIIRPQLPDLDFTLVGPPIGERFPDVRLPDQSGEAVDLHDYRDGHRLLFVVHRSADW